MLKYVNVYGKPNNLLPKIFRALMQNSENIKDVMKNYERIGVIYISRDCEAYDVQEKEKLEVVGAFTYDVSTTKIGKIVAAEVFIGNIEYEEVLEGVTEEVEHLRLHASGVPAEKHHDIITKEFRKNRIKSFKQYQPVELELAKLYQPVKRKRELSGWSISYFPAIRSTK